MVRFTVHHTIPRIGIFDPDYFEPSGLTLNYVSKMASGSDKRELISPPSTRKSPIWEHFGLRFTEENGRKIPVPNVTT